MDYFSLLQRWIHNPADAYAGAPTVVVSFEITLLVLFSVLSFYATRTIIRTALAPIVARTKNHWDDMLFKRKVFHRLSFAMPGVLLYLFAALFPVAGEVMRRVAQAWLVFVTAWSFSAFLMALNDGYERLPVSKSRPIKGVLQIVAILTYLATFIVIIAIVINRSPVVILSGIGAMTAVLILVFKDTLLSFVAGLQISANNTIRKGDWIVMQKYGADGEVIDISLHNLRIQNWDKTITIIPTHKLLEESFINWRGMEESGGRRISRSLLLDMQSIRFLTENEVRELGKIELLKDYLHEKTSEITLDNDTRGANLSHPVNGRQLTNFGTFRAYVYNYLRNHPSIRQDMTLLVRQLQPTETGIPLQVYVFTNTTEWALYENIQSDIFDHLIATVPYFHLSLFQNPSGSDIRSITTR